MLVSILMSFCFFLELDLFCKKDNTVAYHLDNVPERLSIDMSEYLSTPAWKKKTWSIAAKNDIRSQNQITQTYLSIRIVAAIDCFKILKRK